MKRKIIKWKQEKLFEADITKLVAGTGMSMRQIALGCGLHHTYISRCMSGHNTMTEQTFAKLTNFLEDNQL